MITKDLNFRGSDVGLLPSLALLSGALLALAVLTVPLAITSSTRLTQSERDLLDSLNRRDVTLQPRVTLPVQVDLGMPVRRYSQRVFDIVVSILILVFFGY